MPTTGTATAQQSAVGARTAVTAAGLVAALASAGYISGVILLRDMSSAEAQSAPITVVESLLAGLAYVVLAVSLPALGGATRVPRWALSLGAAGCVFIAIQAWATGSIVADLGNRFPEQFAAASENPTFLLQLLYYPMSAVCLVGFASLAIAAWRHRAFSRGASVLLIVAGAAALLGPFPPTGLLAGLGFVWAVRSMRSVE